MKQLNLGGLMPDGARAPDLFIEASEFVCASGVMLSQGAFTGLLGKLCLTTRGLVMLPYQGAMVEVVNKLAERLEKTILGPYADMAQKLKEFGLYAKGPEILRRVLVWPLSALDADAEVMSHILGGADLIVTSRGQKYEFNMRGKGHQPAGSQAPRNLEIRLIGFGCGGDNCESDRVTAEDLLPRPLARDAVC